MTSISTPKKTMEIFIQISLEPDEAVLAVPPTPMTEARIQSYTLHKGRQYVYTTRSSSRELANALHKGGFYLAVNGKSNLSLSVFAHPVLAVVASGTTVLPNTKTSSVLAIVASGTTVLPNTQTSPVLPNTSSTSGLPNMPASTETASKALCKLTLSHDSVTVSTLINEENLRVVACLEQDRISAETIHLIRALPAMTTIKAQYEHSVDTAISRMSCCLFQE